VTALGYFIGVDNATFNTLMIRRVTNPGTLGPAPTIAGLHRIPAVVREIDDKNLLELALIENIQREDLNPIEEAQAYRKLIDTVGLTQESLASRVGRDRSYITNYLRLLRLPDDIQKLVAEGKLSTGHARTLLGLVGVDEQRRIARRVLDRGLSVRETEAVVRRLTEGGTEKKSRSRTLSNDPNVRAAEAKLRRRFSTQVRILHDANGTGGTIELAFYTASDLDRVFDLLMCKSV
jgi:ParB family chromosome partitioning protein